VERSRTRAKATCAGRQIVGLLVGSLIAASSAPADDHDLIVGNRRLGRAADRLASARERSLSGCAVDVSRCPNGAAACHDAAEDRCRHRLDGLADGAARTASVARTVGRRLGSALLDADDGLGYALLAPFCPAVPVPEDDPDAAMVCQHRALDCTADRTIAVLAPRASAMLAGMDAVAPDCFTVSACGDGVVDETEDCDAGAANSDVLADHCRRNCREPDCGDGVVDEDEECDDGNTVDGDGCDADCASEADACGNGVLDGDEECDDGNAIAGDGCDDECILDTSVCGDGIESDDEECDEGAVNSDVLPDRCRTTCRSPSCGDGIVDPEEGEECEPPGTLLCTATCETRIALPLDRVLGGPRSPGRCARAIIHRGVHMFTATRHAIGGCVQAAARCALDDEASDRCVATAAARCHRAAASRDRLRAAMRVSAGRVCNRASITLSLLLDPRDGLGFRDVAAGCWLDGARPAAMEDLLDCLAARAACLGERAVTEGIPRAYDFLSEVVDDPDTEFPCIVDPDEVSSPSAAFVEPAGT
jgi:cysteine-rich repeat protein